LAVLGLCLVYGIVFPVVFIVTVIGLAAPSSQAAQGMSMVAFVFAFISSTYVPVSTMPGWLEPFARRQPGHADGRRGQMGAGPARPARWS